MATYYQKFEFYETEGETRTTVLMVFADVFTSLYSALSGASEINCIARMPIIREDLDNNEGQLKLDVCDFEVDEGITFFSADGAFQAWIRQVADIANPRFCAVFIDDPAYDAGTAPSLSNQVFGGAVEHRYDADDIEWYGAKWTAETAPRRFLRFTASVGIVELLRQLNLRDLIHGNTDLSVTGFTQAWIDANVADRQAYVSKDNRGYGETDYRILKWDKLVSLSAVLNGLLDNAEATLTAQGVGTFNLSINTRATVMRFAPAHFFAACAWDAKASGAQKGCRFLTGRWMTFSSGSAFNGIVYKVDKTDFTQLEIGASPSSPTREVFTDWKYWKGTETKDSQRITELFDSLPDLLFGIAKMFGMFIRVVQTGNNSFSFQFENLESVKKVSNVVCSDAVSVQFNTEARSLSERVVDKARFSKHGGRYYYGMVNKNLRDFSGRHTGRVGGNYWINVDAFNRVFTQTPADQNAFVYYGCDFGPDMNNRNIRPNVNTSKAYGEKEEERLPFTTGVAVLAQKGGRVEDFWSMDESDYSWGLFAPTDGHLEDISDQLHLGALFPVNSVYVDGNTGYKEGIYRVEAGGEHTRTDRGDAVDPCSLLFMKVTPQPGLEMLDSYATDIWTQIAMVGQHYGAGMFGAGTYMFPSMSEWHAAHASWEAQYFTSEVNIEVAGINAFQYGSDPNYRGWKYLRVGAPFPYGGATYYVVGIERDLQEGRTRVRLQASGRFAFGTAPTGYDTSIPSSSDSIDPNYYDTLQAVKVSSYVTHGIGNITKGAPLVKVYDCVSYPSWNGKVASLWSSYAYAFSKDRFVGYATEEAPTDGDYVEIMTSGELLSESVFGNAGEIVYIDNAGGFTTNPHESSGYIWIAGRVQPNPYKLLVLILPTYICEDII